MTEPPLEVGAVHVTVSFCGPAAAATLRGGPGATALIIPLREPLWADVGIE